MCLNNPLSGLKFRKLRLVQCGDGCGPAESKRLVNHETDRASPASHRHPIDFLLPQRSGTVQRKS
jgi:hypothetical protein